MLKQYLINGKQFQFEEGKEPKGATPFTSFSNAKTEEKVSETLNKSLDTGTKTVGRRKKALT